MLSVHAPRVHVAYVYMNQWPFLNIIVNRQLCSSKFSLKNSARLCILHIFNDSQLEEAILLNTLKGVYPLRSLALITPSPVASAFLKALVIISTLDLLIGGCK